MRLALLLFGALLILAGYIRLIIVLKKRSTTGLEFLNKLLFIAGVAGFINTIAFLLISKYGISMDGGNNWQTPETVVKSIYYGTNSLLVTLAAINLKKQKFVGMVLLLISLVSVLASLFIHENGGLTFLEDNLFSQTLLISVFVTIYFLVPPLGTLTFLGGLFANALALRKWRVYLNVAPPQRQ